MYYHPNQDELAQLSPTAHQLYLHNQPINYSEAWRVVCSHVANVFQKEAKQFLQEHDETAQC